MLRNQVLTERFYRCISIMECRIEQETVVEGNKLTKKPRKYSRTSSHRPKDIDPDTMEALRQGNHDAYKKIYYKYRAGIKHYLLVLTRSEDIANDLAQEVLLKVWEKRETLQPEQGIVRFLFSLARQAIVHHYRREEVRDSYARNLSLDDIGGVQGDELLEAEETQILIEIAVSRMPKIRQEVFKLSRYEGFSVPQIASQLNISNDSVSSHLYNALRDIKKVIAVFTALFIFQ